MGFADVAAALFNEMLPNNTPEADLATIVNKYILRQPSGRSGLHVSDLVHLCMRKIAFKQRYPNMVDLPASAYLMRIFEAGHQAHDCFRNKWHGPSGFLFGIWVCSRCGKRVESFYPTGCTTLINGIPCNETKARWEYEEYKLSHSGFKLFGSIDGLVKFKNEMYLIDYKTIATKAFEELTKPEDSYVRQISIYQWMMKEAKWVAGHANHKLESRNAPKKGLIAYIQKDTYAERIFEVEFQENIGADIQETLQTAQETPTDKILARLSGSCRSKKSTYAKSCAYRQLCFGG